MATRLFEEKEHVYYYQKYRFSPPKKIQDMIFSYVHHKLDEPYELAVDVGCGTGQNTKILASHFEKVLGVDISQAQIEEAKIAVNLPNTTFRVSPAEEVSVDNATVDLLAAHAAVHWFDIGKFMKEMHRILKPGGCIALFCYYLPTEIYYKDRSEQMSKVISEIDNHLSKYQHEKMNLVRTGYKDIFEAIPYTNKLRRDDILTNIRMTLADLMGFVHSLSLFQIYRSFDPEKAMDFMKTTEERFLEIMEAPSSETEFDVCFKYVLLLASKPK
ncbi:putative methyltransferase DDB_G0268948 [Phyllobates terribilis]|uniref:putative methyltransferase DDB_G0268948 n=1 Tax=Phyllobates terribilis TaxID=111132 RepID=UPI003CCADF04